MSSGSLGFPGLVTFGFTTIHEWQPLCSFLPRMEKEYDPPLGVGLQKRDPPRLPASSVLTQGKVKMSCLLRIKDFLLLPQITRRPVWERTSCSGCYRNVAFVEYRFEWWYTVRYMYAQARNAYSQSLALQSSRPPAKPRSEELPRPRPKAGRAANSAWHTP